jgi:tetratricopeptide (TPR) repeat protein
LGEDHLDTLRVANNLGFVLKELGQLDEAGDLFVRSLAGRRRILGNGHADTLGTIHNLASLDLKRRRHARAETLVREAVQGRRKLGTGGSDLARSLTLLGRVLLETKRAQEAEQPLREALAIDRKVLHPGHWETASNESLLGECLMSQKHFREVEPLLIAGHEGLCGDPGAPPIQVRQTVERLIAYYDSQGQAAQACTWRARLLDTQFPADPFAP